MRKLLLVAAAGLALVSVAAYAQMPRTMQGQDPSGAPMGHMGMPRAGTADGGMHGRMGAGMMHQAGMHQGMMPHGMMHQGGMMHRGMDGTGHGGGGHGGAHADLPKGDRSPSSLAFHGINRKMHEAMDITFTGNADVDFVAGMIPHHEGAVEMAKTVLAFGKDPEIRKLAEDIIKAQESEIALMRAWLKRNAPAAAAGR